MVLPFHSFGELISSDDQQCVLARISESLAPGGRLIWTLQNPSQRLRSVDGPLRFVGTSPGVDPQTPLLFGSASTYDQARNIVHGLHFDEPSDQQGTWHKKRMLQIRFALRQRAEFEALAEASGFPVLSFSGDSDSSLFPEETRPSMIGVRGKEPESERGQGSETSAATSHRTGHA